MTRVVATQKKHEDKDRDKDQPTSRCPGKRTTVAHRSLAVWSQLPSVAPSIKANQHNIDEAARSRWPLFEQRQKFLTIACPPPCWIESKQEPHEAPSRSRPVATNRCKLTSCVRSAVAPAGVKR